MAGLGSCKWHMHWTEQQTGESRTARCGQRTQAGVELQVYEASPLISINTYWTVTGWNTPHLKDHTYIPDAGVSLKHGKSQLVCLPQAMQLALYKQTNTSGGVIKGTAGMNLGSATAWQQIQGRLEDHTKWVLNKVHSPPVGLRCPIRSPFFVRVKITNTHTTHMCIDSYK